MSDTEKNFLEIVDLKKFFVSGENCHVLRFQADQENFHGRSTEKHGINAEAS